jgi:3-(3-hydroxy-phenyl)propionate hydroxylase
MLGLGAQVVAGGLVCPDWQVRMHPSGERAVFDLSVLAADTAHPYRLQYEQWRLSELLLTRLSELPAATVRFGHEVTGVAQDEEGVTLTLEGPAGPEQVRAALAVGADGARSAVRGALGLSFDGLTYPETTLLATTTFPFEDHLDGLSNVSYCWKEDGNFALLKVPGRWRVSIYPRDDRPLEEQTTPEGIDAALREIVPREQAYDIGETRPYRVHQRIVPSYVSGRVALAGDAAHVNAPSGGMGMNGGVHDAFELAEALTDILRRGAGLDRLALYDRRRRPVAREQILAQADRNRARMREKDPARRREILADLQAVTRDRERLYQYVLRSSMIEGLRQARLVA